MKKAVILFLLLSAVLFAQERKLGVAVNEFVPKNGVSRGEAETLRDIFQAELVNTGAYRVLERNKIDEILKEQEFQVSGCTESECAVEIGKLLNVEIMFIGQLMRLGSSYKVIISVVDVATGQIIASPNEKFSSMDIADAKVKILAERIAYGNTSKLSGVENIEVGKVDKVTFDADVKALDDKAIRFESVKINSSANETTKKIAQAFSDLIDKADLDFKNKAFNSAEQQYKRIIEKYDTNLADHLKGGLKSYKSASKERLRELYKQRINYQLSEGDKQLDSLPADALQRYYKARRYYKNTPSEYSANVSSLESTIKDRVSVAHKKYIEQLFVRGDEKFDKGNYKSALDEYEYVYRYFSRNEGEIQSKSVIENSIRNKIIVAYQGQVIKLNNKANDEFGNQRYESAEKIFSNAASKAKECRYYGDIKNKPSYRRNKMEEALLKAAETSANGKRAAYESQINGFRNQAKSYSEQISYYSIVDEKSKAKTLLEDLAKIIGERERFSSDTEVLKYFDASCDMINEDPRDYTYYLQGLGKVTLRSTVPGAKVYVGSKYIGKSGKSPLTFEASPGRYRVKMTKDPYYKPLTKTIGIERFIEKTIKMEFGKRMGRLKVTAKEKGVKVYMDGRYLGKSPIDTLVPAGRVKLEGRNGQGAKYVDISPEKLSTVKLDVSLPIHPGEILYWGGMGVGGGMVATGAVLLELEISADIGIGLIVGGVAIGALGYLGGMWSQSFQNPVGTAPKPYDDFDKPSFTEPRPIGNHRDFGVQFNRRF